MLRIQAIKLKHIDVSKRFDSNLLPLYKKGDLTVCIFLDRPMHAIDRVNKR